MTDDPHLTYLTLADATVWHGDCLEQLRRLPDACVDSVVTDPPYGLSFMGKRWDYDVPSVEVWAECLRVLKPGGHLLAFAGTRTQHRMAVRIEDAGFEIRDMIAWVYGSGFPKSLDVSKAIDKAGGISPAAQASRLRAKREAAGLTREQVAEAVGCTLSSIRDWEEGRARSAGGALEFMVPSSAYRSRLVELFEYASAADREVTGSQTKARSTSGASALPTMGADVEYRTWDTTDAATDAARQWEGWGTALKPSLEPITVARKPLASTVAANVLAHGTGALNIDGCRVGNDVRFNAAAGNVAGGNSLNMSTVGMPQDAEGRTASGRWPANLIHDGSDEVRDAFPTAPGQQGLAKTDGSACGNTVYGAMRHGTKQPEPRVELDKSAARFFYAAKASRKDRDEGNTHPTVKPTDLMRYLCRLVTPPGGLVLDPFTGSGSTGKAARLEGFRFLGCELSEEYAELARRRIEAVS